MYTSGTTGKPKGLVHTSGGYLTQASWSFEHLFSNPDPALRDAGRALVHGGPRLGHRAHLRDLRPALQRRHAGDLRGHAQHPAPGPALRNHRTLRRHAVLHRAHPGPLPDGLVPGRRPGHATTSPPSGCSAPSARPSTPRPGAGSGTTSAPAPPPWWTPGGSPKPAPPSSPPPRRTPTFKPGCAARPLPGVSTRIVDDAGNTVPPGVQGFIVVDTPGPAIARTVWGNPQRYFDSYWRQYAEQGWFLAGDGAKYDDDGDIWILGRVDDTLNVSGHLLSTIEIESALVSHPDVVEAGVCPVADPKTGHAIVAFVVLKDSAATRRQSPRELRNHVAKADRADRQAARRRRRSRCAEDPQRQDHAPAADPAVRRHRARRHHLAPERTVHRGHPGCPARPRNGTPEVKEHS